MSDWRRALLNNLGYKPTKANLKFLEVWQRWEGGHTANDASFNWLNTTKNAPGATRSINSVGVKAFDSFRNGVAATAATLKNGRYQDILDGLSSGDPYHSNMGAGLQVWVSGSPTGNPGYADKVLGGKASSSSPVGTSGKSVRAPAMPKVPKVRGIDKSILLAERAVFGGYSDIFKTLQSLQPLKGKETKPTLAGPGGKASPLTPEVGNKVVNNVLAAAATQLGKPYVFGSGPDTSSFDCSDLIQWAYKQVGINIPRDTYGQMKVFPKKAWKDLKPGDPIYKDNGGHVVMYVGNGKVIAAPYTGAVVRYEDLSRFQSGGYHVRSIK